MDAETERLLEMLTMLDVDRLPDHRKYDLFSLSDELSQRRSLPEIAREVTELYNRYFLMITDEAKN